MRLVPVQKRPIFRIRCGQTSMGRHNPEHPPECCRDCGMPFNDAEPPPSGLCSACSGGSR